MSISGSQYQAACAKAMSEKELLATVTQMAQALGYLTYHTWRSIHSEGGWPDVAIAGHGRFLLRELKSQSGKLAPDQEAWLAALSAAGVDVGVWRPIDLLEGRILEQLQVR